MEKSAQSTSSVSLFYLEMWTLFHEPFYLTARVCHQCISAEEFLAALDGPTVVGHRGLGGAAVAGSSLPGDLAPQFDARDAMWAWTDTSYQHNDRTTTTHQTFHSSATAHACFLSRETLVAGHVGWTRRRMAAQGPQAPSVAPS